MSNNLDKLISKLCVLCVCETAADIKSVLETVTDEELEDLKKLCKESALSQIRKLGNRKSSGSFGTGNTASWNTCVSQEPKHNDIMCFGGQFIKPIKAEELDTISGSIPTVCNPFFRVFQSRLNSFTFPSGQWKYEHIMPGKTLAQAGFFNLGKDGTDAVQCFACGQGVFQWEKGDCPFFDHYKYNGNCGYIRKLLEIYPQVSASIKDRLNRLKSQR